MKHEQEHPMAASASDDLAGYLAAVQRGSRYRAIRRLDLPPRSVALAVDEAAGTDGGGFGAVDVAEGVGDEVVDAVDSAAPAGGEVTAAGDRAADAGERGMVTELVEFEAADGAVLGPFVRKRIDLTLGVGGAYEELAAAQRAGMRMQHVPRIVECYKTGLELVVISEYVPGETLLAHVAREGASPACAAEVMPLICDAVIELHSIANPPIVHRDLTPANIILSPAAGGSVATLIDFGIARRYRDDAATDTTHFGTRAYAPPEQYGFGQTSVRTDVYALGMLASFCCTGVSPEGRRSSEDLCAAGVPTSCAAVIATATAFDPAQRYESAAAFRQAFAEACAREGVKGAGSIGERGPIPRLSASGTAVPALDAARPPAWEPDAPALRANDDGLRRTVAVPSGWGHAWNVVLALIAVVFVVVGTQSLGNPVNGKEQPLAVSVYITYALSLPLILGVLYLMLNRRCLAVILPRAAARPRMHDARNLAIYLVIAFFGGVIVSWLF